MIEVTGFRDERLLLDLLNSTPVLAGAVSDLLTIDGPTWTRERGGMGTAAEIASLRRVRDGLQAVIRNVEQPGTLEPLLSGLHLAPRVLGSGLAWQLIAADDEVLSARALTAWGAVQASMPGRLRPCANEECRLFLLDRSKPNTARWCSMKVCGNRVKARRHYDRLRRENDGRSAV